MSRVAAGQLGLSESTYRHGVANYNAAKIILKGMHLHDSSTAAIELPEFLSMVRDGRSEEVLASLPEKQARDAAGTLAALQSGQADPALAPFWASAGTAPFRSAIAAGISAAFLFAGIAYLVIMIAAARYIERPPPGWMPERMKADVDAGKRKVIPDLTQLTANAAVRRAPFYGLWVMMFINISCGIGIIYTASPLAQESIGLTPAQAAGVVGLMSIFNGLGRLGWASLSDYLGRPGTYTAFFIIQIVAFWVLPDITSVILFQIVLYLILTCYGGGFATLPAYIGDLFGTKELGAIHGYVLSAWGLAGVTGPQLVARLYQATGSYQAVLHVFSVVFVVALVVSIMMTIHVINARNRMTTATIFSFDGVDFIRIQTTLLTAEGKPALNTKLDRESASYQALVQNHSYRGEATIFGRKYDTYYAPLTSAQGKLDGAIFVGNQK
jgi:hypothetical protein